MSPVTHLLTGWVLANTIGLGRRDRLIVTVAAVMPDIDGLGAIADTLTRNSNHPLDWFARYHHSLHNVGFALLIAVAAYLLATQPYKATLLALASVHLHLLEDLVGSRGADGYQWPIPYLMPFSPAVQLTWHGQWALNAWPNVFLTLLLLTATFYLSWTRGFSLLEVVSRRADAVFVMALRQRFPGRNRK